MLGAEVRNITLAAVLALWQDWGQEGVWWAGTKAMSPTDSIVSTGDR